MSDVVVGTQTLSPAAKITVSGGDVLSLASGGSVVVFSSGLPVTTKGLGCSAAFWSTFSGNGYGVKSPKYKKTNSHGIGYWVDYRQRFVLMIIKILV